MPSSISIDLDLQLLFAEESSLMDKLLLGLFIISARLHTGGINKDAFCIDEMMAVAFFKNSYFNLFDYLTHASNTVEILDDGNLNKDERIHAKHLAPISRMRIHNIRSQHIEGVIHDADIKKRIAGHSISDITEQVYMHRSIEELKREIEKIQI